jgi:hypothetical protein
VAVSAPTRVLSNGDRFRVNFSSSRTKSLKIPDPGTIGSPFHYASMPTSSERYRYEVHAFNANEGWQVLDTESGLPATQNGVELTNLPHEEALEAMAVLNDAHRRAIGEKFPKS